MAHMMATQTLIWETVVGERDSNFNHVDPGSYDAVSDRISTNHPLYSQYISYYNSMVSNVQKHSKVPSFFAKSTAKAQEIDLEWNGTNYSATLTDTNNVLGNFTFSADVSGIKFSVSGNQLTISANTAPTKSVGITATKTGSVRKGVIIWSDGVYAPGQGQQDLSTYAAEVNDPVRGYLNVKVSAGSAKIVKTSEDGNVSGISFTITGNGVNQTVKTGSNGEITINNLAPGTYTVTEQSINYYEPQQSKTVTVVSGQTASVSFNNVLKRSDLKVIKTSEDNMNEGVKFRLYGKSTSGQNIDLYATTNAEGVAVFKDVLIGTNYTLEEVDTAERYIVPDSQNAVIEWEKVTENDFYNELKRGDLKVVKTSEDGLVEGMKFHLYGTSLSGIAVDEYAVTDKNGIAVFEDVLIGSRYTLKEVDTAEKYIIPDAQTVEVEWNKVTETSFENILKRGDLKVVKTAEDKLVEGLKFHLYRWLSKVYESIRPVDNRGQLIWASVGAKTMELVHENIIVEDVHEASDSDILELDADLIDDFIQGREGAQKKAKKIEIDLVARILTHTDDPRFIKLGERLEELREKHVQGLITSIEFLKHLLELAHDAVKAEKEVVPVAEVDRGKAALTELFNGVKNSNTPIIVERIVKDIDDIVRIVRFDGWQDTVAGRKEVKKALRGVVSVKYKIKDREVFDKAYQYVEQYY